MFLSNIVPYNCIISEWNIYSVSTVDTGGLEL